MNTKLKNLVMGSVIATSLALSASSVLAHDYWHWSEQQRRWDRRADLRSDYRDLAQARRQLEYDRAHHANRKTVKPLITDADKALWMIKEAFMRLRLNI